MKNLIQNLNRAMFVAILVNLQVEAQVVTVYSGANRGGTSRNFTTAGDYTLTDWDVKSIAIQNGYIVQMANEGGCTGICTYIRNESGSERGILGARGCSIKIYAMTQRMRDWNVSLSLVMMIYAKEAQ